jgi:hypothetical protein
MNGAMDSAMNSGALHLHERVNEFVAAIFALMNSVCGTYSSSETFLMAASSYLSMTPSA